VGQVQPYRRVEVRSRVEGIVTDRADHVHVGTKPCGGHGLVAAFATVHREKAFPEQGFAGRRKTRRHGDQIHIDAADDDQAGHDALAGMKICESVNAEARRG